MGCSTRLMLVKPMHKRRADGVLGAIRVYIAAIGSPASLDGRLGQHPNKLGIWVLNTRVEALAGKCTTSLSTSSLQRASGAETSERYR